MEDDDLYKNDGTYFLPTEPPEQRIARTKERAKTLEALSELKKVVQRLDERIEFYQSVTSIPDAVRAKPEEFLIMHNTHTLMTRTLIDEREYIASLIEMYAPSL